MLDLTLASNCYEKNFRVVTNEEWARSLFLFENHDIKTRTLLVSNIVSRAEAKSRIENLINKQIIDKTYFSYDYLNIMQKEFLGCETNTFLRKPKIQESIHELIRGRKIKKEYDGMLYSISQIAAVLTCETEWLVFVTEDVKLDASHFGEWIKKSIECMQKDDKIIVANPIWNNKKEEAQKEAYYEDDDFWYSYGFSDQCCLLNIKRIKRIPQIFSETNKITEKVFPFYAGNHFERRISAYMRNHDLHRITYKHSSYIHNDITVSDLTKYN